MVFTDFCPLEYAVTNFLVDCESMGPILLSYFAFRKPKKMKLS